MSTISNSYVNTTSLASQGTQSTSVSQTAQTETEDANKKSTRLDGSDIVVSSRVKKLQALASEFFAGGVASADIAALKERAFEYGLISQQQFNSLTVPSSQNEEEEQTSQSLADELNKVKAQIEKRNNQVPEDERQDVSSVTSVLTSAANILTDPEEAITNEQFKSQIASAIKDLNGIIDSDTFGNLPLNERVSITNSASALSVIESLAPRNLSNDKLNKYLANSFG